MTAPGKLTVGADGRITGPAKIQYNDPWPCVNGEWGSGAMMGVLMHTEDGYEGGTIGWFNNPAAKASAHFAVGRDGTIHQFGPIGQGWIAWHAADANPEWYGIEEEDDENPPQPLTDAQITATAQLVECLSAFAAFLLQTSNDPGTKGYGTHSMGGVAWGNHLGCPGPVRSAQRDLIIALTALIRRGATPPPMPGAVTWEMWPAGVTLQDGAEGDAVRVLQTALRDSGIEGVRGITVDGDFASQTLTSVRNFQRHAFGPTGVDGIAGPQTRAALEGLNDLS